MEVQDFPKLFPQFFSEYLPLPALRFFKLCKFIWRRWLSSFHDQLLENVNKFLGRAPSPLPCCQLSRIKLNKPRNLHGIYKFPQRKFKWALLSSFTFLLVFSEQAKTKSCNTWRLLFCLFLLLPPFIFPILVVSEQVRAHTEKSLCDETFSHFFYISTYMRYI